MRMRVSQPAIGDVEVGTGRRLWFGLLAATRRRWRVLA
jgi:hypothetical protein